MLMIALLLKIEENVPEWGFKAEFKSWDDTITITLVK